jgi:hypothetical protein
MFGMRESKEAVRKAEATLSPLPKQRDQLLLSASKTIFIRCSRC